MSPIQGENKAYYVLVMDLAELELPGASLVRSQTAQLEIMEDVKASNTQKPVEGHPDQLLTRSFSSEMAETMSDDNSDSIKDVNIPIENTDGNLWYIVPNVEKVVIYPLFKPVSENKSRLWTVWVAVKGRL